MPKVTPHCTELIRNYKKECNLLETAANLQNPDLSHGQVLRQILVISKRGIPLRQMNQDAIKSFKTLLYHARKCYRGRLRYLNECLFEGEADIGHAVELEKIRNIYLAMEKSFAQVRRTLDETESDAVFEERRAVHSARGSESMWTAFEDEDSDSDPSDGGVTETKHSESKETTEKQRARVQRSKQHRENLRLLKESLCQTRESKLADLQDYMNLFGSFFSDNMQEVHDGSDEVRVQFEPFRNLFFTADQLKRVVFACKFMADMFHNFIFVAFIIRRQGDALGIHTGDCINALERVASRTYLFAIFRIPFSKFYSLFAYLVVRPPEDLVLDNLDHLARVDPMIFLMLSQITELEEVAKDMKAGRPNLMFELAKRPTHEFQFIVGTVSKSLSSKLRRGDLYLELTEFEEMYKTTLSLANAFLERGRTNHITIPLANPDQKLCYINKTNNGLVYTFVFPVLVTENEDGGKNKIQLPTMFEPVVTRSELYILDVSYMFVKERRNKHNFCFFLKYGEEEYVRSDFAMYGKGSKSSDFSIEYIDWNPS